VAEQGFEVTAVSAAPVAAVYDLLADGAGWHRWAGPLVRRSWVEADGTRRLGSWPVFSRERTVEADPPHHLAYVIVSGQPVRNYRADVWLTATPEGGTLIRWRSRFEPRLPGVGPVLRRIVGGFAGRLAAAAASR
jgi:uncharacterized protein YndB with AHSA1/START domain